MSCPKRKSALSGRKDERVLIDLPVRIADGGDGVMRNVSASGVYFQTQRALEAGQTVATIEAMKMEAAITTPVAGTVVRLAIPVTQQVDAGDLLVVVE